jgi:hypothetical protein
LIGTLKLLFSEHEFRAKLAFLNHFCQEIPGIPSIYILDGQLSIYQKEDCCDDDWLSLEFGSVPLLDGCIKRIHVDTGIPCRTVQYALQILTKKEFIQKLGQKAGACYQLIF